MSLSEKSPEVAKKPLQKVVITAAGTGDKTSPVKKIISATGVAEKSPSREVGEEEVIEAPFKPAEVKQENKKADSSVQKRYLVKALAVALVIAAIVTYTHGVRPKQSLNDSSYRQTYCYVKALKEVEELECGVGSQDPICEANEFTQVPPTRGFPIGTTRVEVLLQFTDEYQSTNNAIAYWPADGSYDTKDKTKFKEEFPIGATPDCWVKAPEMEWQVDWQAKLLFLDSYFWFLVSLSIILAVVGLLLLVYAFCGFCIIAGLFRIGDDLESDKKKMDYLKNPELMNSNQKPKWEEPL